MLRLQIASDAASASGSGLSDAPTIVVDIVTGGDAVQDETKAGGVPLHFVSVLRDHEFLVKCMVLVRFPPLLNSVPIIILSARDQEREKVAALDGGADDYLTKPFGVSELLARVRVALRHAARISNADEPERTTS